MAQLGCGAPPGRHHASVPPDATLTRFRGILVARFEGDKFAPCDGSGERWWAWRTWNEAVEERLHLLADVKVDPRCRAGSRIDDMACAAYVELLGERSPEVERTPGTVALPNGYGHGGLYTSEVRIAKLERVERAIPSDCSRP